MQIAKSVSVIIPTFNGKDLLLEILPSVLSALEFIEDSEIIIVDDASTDNTLELIQNSFPEVHLISNDENLGFAQTINLGIYTAKYDLVLLLNNDIKLTPDYLLSSISYFNHSDTFGVMGAILDSNRIDILEGIKIPSISLSGIGYKDYSEKLSGQDSDFYTLYLCGGNAIIDRKMLMALGGFSLQYEPFYLEDVDLSIRAWLSDWKLYYNPNAICYHKHSTTIKKHFNKEYISTISKRNRLRLNYIFLTGIEKQIFLILAKIKFWVYMIFNFINVKSSYTGYKLFFHTLSEIHPYKFSQSKKLNQIFREIRIKWKENR